MIRYVFQFATNAAYKSATDEFKNNYFVELSSDCANLGTLPLRTSTHR